MRAQAARVPLRPLHRRTSRTAGAQPRNDVMTELATATFPDGTLPEVHDVMLIAANLFAAGQETTARMLGTALRYARRTARTADSYCAPNPRASRAFIEEVVRIEARSRATSGWRGSRPRSADVDVPAGTTVMVHRRRGEPRPAPVRQTRRVRHRSRERAPARRVRVRHPRVCGRAARRAPRAACSIERILDRMSDITISEAEHGPPGDRRYHYTPDLHAPRPRSAPPGVHAGA